MNGSPSTVTTLARTSRNFVPTSESVSVATGSTRCDNTSSAMPSAPAVLNGLNAPPSGNQPRRTENTSVSRIPTTNTGTLSATMKPATMDRSAVPPRCQAASTPPTSAMTLASARLMRTRSSVHGIRPAMSPATGAL